MCLFSSNLTLSSWRRLTSHRGFKLVKPATFCQMFKCCTLQAVLLNINYEVNSFCAKPAGLVFSYQNTCLFQYFLLTITVSMMSKPQLCSISCNNVNEGTVPFALWVAHMHRSRCGSTRKRPFTVCTQFRTCLDLTNPFIVIFGLCTKHFNINLWIWMLLYCLSW